MFVRIRLFSCVRADALCGPSGLCARHLERQVSVRPRTPRCLILRRALAAYVCLFVCDISGVNHYRLYVCNVLNADQPSSSDKTFCVERLEVVIKVLLVGFSVCIYYVCEGLNQTICGYGKRFWLRKLDFTLCHTSECQSPVYNASQMRTAFLALLRGALWWAIFYGQYTRESQSS